MRNSSCLRLSNLACRSGDKLRCLALVIAVSGTAGSQNTAAFANRQDISSIGQTVSVTRLNHKVPAKALSFFQRGVKFALAGDARKATMELRAAIAIDPDFSEAHANLGAEYTALGELDRAVVVLRRAIQIDPSTSVYHKNLAYALYLLKQLVEAESEAQTAVALDRSDPEARYLLGFLIAVHPERREDAIEHLLYAARQIREARLVLATIYHLTGADARSGAEMQLFYESVSADRSH